VIEYKSFAVNLRKFPTLIRDDSGPSRIYVDSEGNKYESATSFLGRHADKSFLENWKKRVGEKEAAKISERARNRGTQMHECIEAYVLGNPVPHCNRIGRVLFEQSLSALNKINDVQCLETQMYSKTLGLAGTVDCVAKYDGILSVIDFKTSTKKKRKDWIRGYFQQTFLYAAMFYEHTGIWIDDAVIIIATEEYETQVFKCKTLKYRDDILKMKEKDYDKR
jgi:genome maintenance exonuclease 1